MARRAIISALIVAPSCAVYKQSDVEADHLGSSAGDDQGNGGDTAGAMQGGSSAAGAGRSGADGGGGHANGGGSGGTSAGGASAGSGGGAGNGAEAGAAGRGGTTAIGMSGATGMGGAAVAGAAGAKGGTSGATGAGGAGGAAGTSGGGTSGGGTSGAGGGSAVQQLAIGKSTTCSTAQTGHEARLANDADVATRWCATSGGFPQWWRVDLGAVHTLQRIEIRVEHPDRTYLYAIETSLDDAAYTVRANVSGTGTIQASDFAPNVTARYLRVTVTGANPLVVNGNGTWASFYDVALTGI